MFKTTFICLTIVALGAASATAQSGSSDPATTAEAPPLRFEAEPDDPNRPFNPFFKTPGQGDLRGYLPLPPDGGPDRGLGNSSAFDFGGVRNDRRSLTSRRGILFQ